MEIVDTHEEAAELDLPPLLIRKPLEEYFDRQGLGSGPIEAERIGEGHSNVTFLIERGDDRFVLRRPPRPPIPPSANDVLREARLLIPLQDADVRTPEVLAACDDESVLGMPFYVMPFMEGVVITTEVPGELDSPAERRHICEELIDALAEMHAVDWRATELGPTFESRADGYLDRQLKRFLGLWEYNKTRELPVVQEIGEWLTTNKPESPPATMARGNHRRGTTMLAHAAPAKLIAIFDWEMSTIDYPIATMGYTTATWSEPN